MTGLAVLIASALFRTDFIRSFNVVQIHHTEGLDKCYLGSLWPVFYHYLSSFFVSLDRVLLFDVFEFLVTILLVIKKKRKWGGFIGNLFRIAWRVISKFLPPLLFFCQKNYYKNPETGKMNNIQWLDVPQRPQEPQRGLWYKLMDDKTLPDDQGNS